MSRTAQERYDKILDDIRSAITRFDGPVQERILNYVKERLPSEEEIAAIGNEIQEKLAESTSRCGGVCGESDGAAISIGRCSDDVDAELEKLKEEATASAQRSADANCRRKSGNSNCSCRVINAWTDCACIVLADFPESTEADLCICYAAVMILGGCQILV